MQPIINAMVASTERMRFFFGLAPVGGRAIAHQLNDSRQHGRERADDGGDDGFGNAHSGNLKQAPRECSPGLSRGSAGAFRGGYWFTLRGARIGGAGESLRRGRASGALVRDFNRSR